MAVSHWLAQLDPPPALRPALEGTMEADVCVVGGGYTGLWTAYELMRAQPTLRVIVLEGRFVGFGASGRNGGWVLGELAGSRERWAKRSGEEAVRALIRAIADTLSEIEVVVARESIECDLHRGGSLQVAQTPLELRRARALVEEGRRWGYREDEVRMLDAGEAAERIAVNRVCGARLFTPCARVQPAKLVRGLAAAAERTGAVIHEDSPVISLTPGLARTPRGEVHARQIVRATEGYTARLPGLRRALVPLNSAMIATEPLPEETWSQIGWTNCETLHDGQHRYVYLQRTADGRIAIGGRGNPYRFGSVSDREGPLPAATRDELRARLLELFPALHDARIAAGWAGVLGVPRDWCPSVGLDPRTGLAWAGGYVGEGVAAANLAGRTLRDLLLSRDTELTRLPWVGAEARRWEPEPLRYLGVHAVNGLLAAADRRERRTGRPALAARAAALLSGRAW